MIALYSKALAIPKLNGGSFDDMFCRAGPLVSITLAKLVILPTGSAEAPSASWRAFLGVLPKNASNVRFLDMAVVEVL